MLFNSLDFAIFLPIVFLFYWFVFNNNLRLQNIFLLLSSYYFYACWDWRFLSLIAFSTGIDFWAGKQIVTTSDRQIKRRFLVLSLLVNLGFLGFFKYYNFFLDSFIEAFSIFGYSINGSSLSIILPIGISFYTFQTLSYTIDIYRNKVEPTNDLISFAAFVSFFPQLVAGPIERASNLLPQFYRKRTFDYSLGVDGLRQILWGLFKKLVIADNCAQFVDQIFANSAELNGSTLLLGAFFFAFQIYGDFSGYSDIAIGTAHLFGFKLKQNFAFPYFSRDLAEFWRRWHISLSTWFRDYLYIPLGGSRGSTFQQFRNVFLIFIISGFWHGANWTFVFWGGLNALFFLPLLLTGRNRSNLEIIAIDKSFPSLYELIQLIGTFSLVMILWIFFRAENMNHALNYLSGIFSASIIELPAFSGKRDALTTLILILGLMLIEWKGRSGQYAIDALVEKWPKIYRHLLYYGLVVFIIWFSGTKRSFIYFQF